jgi:hypothetical protein
MHRFGVQGADAPRLRHKGRESVFIKLPIVNLPDQGGVRGLTTQVVVNTERIRQYKIDRWVDEGGTHCLLVRFSVEGHPDFDITDEDLFRWIEAAIQPVER